MLKALLLGAAVVLVVVSTAAIQAAYQTYRLGTGPSGWFEVQESLRVRSQGAPGGVVVIGGPYADEAACAKDLGALNVEPFNASLSCQRMLISDAARLPGGMSR